MTLPHFEYAAPKSLSEVLRLLDAYGEQACVMAGGTDLVLRLRERLAEPRLVISLNKIPQLKTISFDPDRALSFGATVLLADVASHKIINERYHALAQGAQSTATVQVRNMGTVVGNLCNAAPCADNAPPLLALDAELVIDSVRGQRTLPLNEFFKGPGETALEPDEMVTRVNVPIPSNRSGSAYVPLSARGKVDMTAIGVSAAITIEGDVCRKARIAVGAAAPIPMRASHAESCMVDRRFDDALVDQASRLVTDEIQPITDVRASAAYRKAMARVLTRRALYAAYDVARSNPGPRANSGEEST